jgi:hypothetical protein
MSPSASRFFLTGRQLLQSHFCKRVVGGDNRFFCTLHNEPSTSARAHSRDRHAPALATYHVALSIKALDHEQLGIDRIHKSFREIAHLFRPCAATILQDVIRKELCTLFIGSLGMGIDVFPFCCFLNS